MKGAFNGICNSSACDNRNAVHYNTRMTSYYCGECAKAINESCLQSGMFPICFRCGPERELQIPHTLIITEYNTDLELLLPFPSLSAAENALQHMMRNENNVTWEQSSVVDEETCHYAGYTQDKEEFLAMDMSIVPGIKGEVA